MLTLISHLKSLETRYYSNFQWKFDQGKEDLSNLVRVGGQSELSEFELSRFYSNTLSKVQTLHSWLQKKSFFNQFVLLLLIISRDLSKTVFYRTSHWTLHTVRHQCPLLFFIKSQCCLIFNIQKKETPLGISSMTSQKWLFSSKRGSELLLEYFKIMIFFFDSCDTCTILFERISKLWFSRLLVVLIQGMPMQVVWYQKRI